MTQDEIIAMAREAEISLETMVLLCGVEIQITESPLSVDELARFADRVAAKEREACARVCDASVEEWLRLDGSHHELTEAQMLADEIRARGQKEGA